MCRAEAAAGSISADRRSAKRVRAVLMLLRHAKSSWAEALPDRDRPLAPRGQRDASLMGAHLHAAGFAPARVLCSPARRTRETLALMRPHWPLPEPTFLEDLYETDADALWDTIQGVGGEDSLVVGHNPGLHDLLRRLVPPPDAPAKMPTGAFAAIDLERGRLLAFAAPKALPAWRR